MAPNITAGGFWNINLLRNVSKGHSSKGDNCASATVKFRASLNHGLMLTLLLRPLFTCYGGGDSRMRLVSQYFCTG